MIKQQYFSDSEWATLLQTPKQAILMIIVADKTDAVSLLKEMQAAVQILAAELQRVDVSSDLVKSVIASLKEIAAQETLQGEQLLLKQQFSCWEWFKPLTLRLMPRNRRSRTSTK